MMVAADIATFALGINYIAVIAAAVGCFVLGAVWYSPLAFGKAWSALRGLDGDATAAARPSPPMMAAEFVRGLLVAYVLARLIVLLGINDLVGAIVLGISIWLGLQATSIVGSVLHEQYPPKLFAIHSGDALVKTMFAAVLLGLWR